MTEDFLLELGCEDLPAGQINQLLANLANGFCTQLKKYNLSFNEAEMQTFATPRRLAILIPDLAAETKAETFERRGPSKAQGFDAQGQPSKALLGFLQSVNANLKDIIEVPTEKGIWLAVKVHKKAEKIEALLPNILAEVIKALPLKKSMRWGDHSFHFLRPVHWFVMLYGKEIVPAELFGVKADRFTYGHRFENLKPIKLNKPQEYIKKLAKAFVIVEPLARRAMIEEQAQALVGEDHVRFNTLPEVINLIEWPHAVLCNFKPEFLKVPKEVLISAMETHQRVFPILNQAGQLKPLFITVSNSTGEDTSEIKLGNEKVVSARLSDAEFFYVSDAKVPLLERLADLKKISFQEQLGTLYDKVTRVTDLAGYLAELLKINKSQVQQAAQLCKCDLTTDMVQEFPELQGIMGREYALKQNINAEIAEALEDHYKPKVRDGDLPRNAVGAVLALADKLDTLVGLFGVGEKPSGSGDPYALRRQALGVIAVMIKFNWSLDLINIIRYSYATFSSSGVKLTPVDQELAEFFLERMAQWCLDEHTEIATSVINAVKSRMIKDMRNKNRLDLDLLEFFDNARDLNEMLTGAEGQELLQLVKRAANIIPEDIVVTDYLHLTEQHEQKLILVYESLAQEISECKKQKQFLKAYNLLLRFKSPLAQFFDHVMVMVEDKQLQQERLSLLYRIVSLFYLLADFSNL